MSKTELVFKTLISMTIPILLVSLFNPTLLKSTDPEMLGCEGPFAGLSLLSGVLMALQMRFALVPSTLFQDSSRKAATCDPTLVPLEN